MFRGTISSYDNLTCKHRIVFDDKTEETVDLFDCYKLISEWQITPKTAEDTEFKDTTDERNKRRETRSLKESLQINPTSHFNNILIR